MSRLLLAVLVLSAAVAVRAQNQPTFRTGANYIRVDMYVTLDGQPVTDLTRDDIELLEDSAPQAIDAFEHVEVRPATSQDARVEPSSVAESRQMAADGRARVFVIFLDTYHTQIEGSANMRLPLVKFLDRVLGPDDLVGVMTPEMAATDLTLGRKTTVISNIMQSEWGWGRRGRLLDNDPKEDLYEACYGSNGPAEEMKARRREKLTLDALDELVVHLNGLREERKAVITVSEGWRIFRPSKELSAADPPRSVSPVDMILRRPKQEPKDTGNLQGVNRIECESDRLTLAMLDHSLRLREITDDANRGNVTFYPVYARGLVAFDAPIGPNRPPGVAQDTSNLRARHDSLRQLADNTDGTAIIDTNNIDGGLRRIVDDMSSYYLLGYYSTNTKLDGRFRTITVRVKRPGVRVRARRGYRGRTANDLLTRSGASDSGSSTGSSPVNAVAGVNPRAPFRIRPSTWSRAGAGGGPEGAFWIVGELDFRTRKELAWTAGARAEVVVLASDGTEVLTKSVEVRGADGTFGLRVPDSGGLAPGEYAVRVRLRSDAENELTLSDSARVVVTGVTPLGEAVVWRRGPSTGPQYLRTADPRFQRSERIRLELATDNDTTSTARVLDRTGKPLALPLAVTTKPDSSQEFHWIVAEVTLAPLAPGDYAIEVTQGKATQVTPFRVVP